MLIDRFTIEALARELNTRIGGSRVNKIFQPTEKVIALDIYPTVEKMRLILSIDRQYGFCGLSSYRKGNPPNIPLFCTVLRKHLTNAVITEFRPSHTDRILDVLLSAKHEEGIEQYRLQLRLTGNKPNLLLFKEDGRPLGKLADYSHHLGYPGEDRDFSAEGLELPPVNLTKENPSPLQADKNTLPELLHNCRNSRELCTEIPRLTPGIAELILKSATSMEDYKTCSDWVMKILMPDCPIEPVLIDNSLSGKKFIFPYGAPSLLPPNTKARKLDSFLHAIEDFYFKKMEENTLISEKRNLLTALRTLKKKITRKKCSLEEGLARSKNSAEYSHDGELLKSVLYKVKRGDKAIKVLDWNTGREKEINLNPRLTPEENLNKIFDRAKKIKRSLPVLKDQIEEVRFTLYQAEKLFTRAESAVTIEDVESTRKSLTLLMSTASQTSHIKLKTKNGKNISSAKERKARKKILHSIRSYTSSDGFKIFVGRNSQENSCLSGKFLQKNDLWFHLADVPGPHVVVKMGNRNDCPSSTKQEACQLAVYFSSRRYEKRSNVHFCYGRDVRNVAGGKAGVVSLRNYNCITISPDREIINSLLQVASD